MTRPELPYPKEVPHLSGVIGGTLPKWRLVVFPNRKRLRWHRGGPVGLCDYDSKRLLVAGDCAEPFWTVVHEVLHAALPHLSEDAVDETERALKRACELYCRMTSQDLPT